MIEQLNLAQTVLAQKPDALLLSPQSDFEHRAGGPGGARGEHPDHHH